VGVVRVWGEGAGGGGGVSISMVSIGRQTTHHIRPEAECELWRCLQTHMLNSVKGRVQHMCLLSHLVLIVR